MFSTTPSSRMFVFCAIAAARAATSCASRCGVVTTTTSARGQQLAERDRDVAGPRRHVHDEHVDLAPVDVGEELLERAVEHRPAPHHRLVAALEEEADRHQLQVVLHRRHDQLVHRDRSLPDAEHVRDRVPVDVRVEHADAVAELRERDREVRGERRLADAALAAGDREHAAVGRKPDHAVALGRAAAQLLRQRLPLLGRHHVERELDAGHARHARRAPAPPAPRTSRAADSRRR